MSRNTAARLLTAEGLDVIQKLFEAVVRSLNCKLIAFNGEADHIHAVIEYPPKLSLSKLANAFKGTSSRRYRQAGLPKPKGGKALWSPSYFASSVDGAPLEVLKEYVKKQEKPSQNYGVLNTMFLINGESTDKHD